MQQACADDQSRAQQIELMLEDRSWEHVARFAASVCQSRNLKLKPWEMPPWHGDSKHHPDPAARKLLQQMLDAGISRWHPDPMAALDRSARAPR
jgi:hypothetical protein